MTRVGKGEGKEVGMGSLIDYERPGSWSHPVWGGEGCQQDRLPPSLLRRLLGGESWLGTCPTAHRASSFPLPQETKGSVAVRVALGETQLVQEVRRFLIENGVSLDSFSQVSTRVRPLDFQVTDVLMHLKSSLMPSPSHLQALPLHLPHSNPMRPIG